MTPFFFKSGTPENTQNLEWLQRHIGYSRGWDTENTVTMAVFKDDVVVAVVAYHDYCPEYEIICLSAFSTNKKWVTRDVLREMHSYPFDHAGCQALIWQVSEHNKPVLRMAKALGYVAHRIPRLRGRDEAEIVNVLYDDVWRNGRFSRKA